MSEEMNLYKRCKNIFKSHGVDMGGGGSGGAAPVLDFMWERRGEHGYEIIVSTELTWSDIANAIKSNPSTVAHINWESGGYLSLPVLMFGDDEDGGEAMFGLSCVMPYDETEEGIPLWYPYGGTLTVVYDPEGDEMEFQCLINMGP